MYRNLANSKFGGIILVIMGMLLCACAPDVSAHPLYATPCLPPTNENNVYRKKPDSILASYYSAAFTGMDFAIPERVQHYETMQHEAIKKLAIQTERWSDSIDIHLQNKNVRLTLTYMSPELLHTVILNQFLFEKNSSFLNGSFETEVLLKMERIASRNEHIFLITLTASKYEQETYTDPTLVRLPLDSLVMTNSENIRVIRLHDDHTLEERIDLTQRPAYGYISYPMAVVKVVNENETCEFFLDNINDTRLTLSIPYIEINNARYETEPWMLDYVPLLSVVSNPNYSNNFPLDKMKEHFCPDREPPTWMASENAEYWEKLARFIWYETTLNP